MRCPIDDTELRITDRQGVEVDYCPTCRGIWLDRGELDKILERSASMPYTEDVDDERDAGQRRRGGGRKRRRSILEELLDFG